MKAQAARTLENVDAIVHYLKVAVQNRNWGDLAEEWRALELHLAVASVAVSELHRRTKAIGRGKPRRRT